MTLVLQLHLLLKTVFVREYKVALSPLAFAWYRIYTELLFCLLAIRAHSQWATRESAKSQMSFSRASVPDMGLIYSCSLQTHLLLC